MTPTTNKGGAAQMEKKSNVLNHEKAARLHEWMRREAVWCAGQTAERCAVKASNVLGFGVTDNNVLSAKRAIGITKPAPVASGCQCRELAAALLVYFNQEYVDCGTACTATKVTALLRGIVGAPKSKRRAPAPTDAAPELPMVKRGCATCEQLKDHGMCAPADSKLCGESSGYHKWQPRKTPERNVDFVGCTEAPAGEGRVA